jgi:DNA-binding NarL/FixJ family response regulator
VRKALADPFEGHGLTLKQKEAITLVAKGFSQENAAKKLGITRSAFSLRIQTVGKKLGIQSREEITRYYLELVRKAAGL